MSTPQPSSLQSRIERSPLYNPDLAPVESHRRTWGTYNFAALWVSMSINILTYMLAASLIQGGMNWKQAIATVFLGNSIVLVPMLLNSHPGARYGIPFPVLARASFGVLGANIAAVLRALVACEKLPDTDSSRIAVVSFSWGGISSLFAASRDSRIQVLAEMDGSMRYYPGLVAKAGSIHPEQLNVPLLFFTSNRENFIEDSEHSDFDMNGRNVLNEWTRADVMTVNMLGMSHPEFCSMCQRWPLAEEHIADYGREDANTSYSWVALYTLQFLNAYMKHDAAAKEFLGKTAADNGVPKHIMGIRFSPGSFAETMRSAARAGEESAWEAFQRFAADPMHRYMTGEEKTINALGYAFLREKNPSAAVVLFKLNTKAYPGSANAWDSLGDGYEATNDVQNARMAYARSVELNPNNEHAKGELAKLRK